MRTNNIFIGIVSVIFISFSSNILNALNLKGHLDGNDIIYTVTITPKDTLYKPLSFTGIEKDFDIELDTIKGDAIVDVTSKDRKPFIKEIAIKHGVNSIDLGNIILEKSIELNEVVVKGGKINIKRNGNNLIIRNVQSSKIGQAGDFFDMLRFTPGVVVKGGTDISILGSGSPKIYINDHEVKNKEELYAYQSTNVSSIEVIRQSDASHNASTSCVIRITTKERYKDYLGLNISNAIDLKEKVSNTTNLNVNVNKGVFAGTTSLSYSHNNGRYNDFSKSIITHSDGSLFKNYGEGVTNTMSNRYNVFVGLNFDMKKKGKIGLQYTGNISNTSDNRLKKQEIEEPTQENIKKENSSNTSGDINVHSVSFSYVLARAKGKIFSIIADYAHKSNNNIKNLHENFENQNNIVKTIITNNNRYDIYTLTPEYKFRFLTKDNEKIGLNAGYIYSSGDSYINEIAQFSTRKNYYIAPYYTFNKTWGKWTLDLGIRYEYDKTITIMTGANPSTMNKSYSNIFPNGTVKYKLNDNIDMSLFYRKRISRPSFNDLNPTIHYDDEYNYSTGNPNLNPTFYDNIEFTFNLYGVGVNVGYSKITDAIEWVALQESENSNVLVMQPINIKRSHSWKISGDYYWSKDWFDVYASATLKIPYMKYPYLNTEKVNNKAYCDLMLQLTFNVYKSISLYLNTNYTSNRSDGATNYGSTICVDAGVSGKFFKDRLYVSIDGSDFFKKSVTPWWEESYLNTYTWQKNNYDTRGVKLTLRWTLNSINSKFMNRVGNMEQLSRTM
ncbi:MAG: TonB-dependent receptor [Muribaculaceae bacterium]